MDHQNAVLSPNQFIEKVVLVIIFKSLNKIKPDQLLFYDY